MKKFFKLLTLTLILALFLITPGVTTVSVCLANLVPTASPVFEHSAPAQSSTVFKSTVENAETYQLSNWTKPTNEYLLAQQVTSATNGSFHDKYKNNTLSNTQISGREPFVIINDTDDMTTSGAYTTNAITLTANSYYIISVDYYVIEQANKDPQIESYAFGTFYLNNEKITLDSGINDWDTAKFYIKTDKLESASVTPALYFGSKTQNAIGGIYFDNFTVTAVCYNEFEDQRNNRTAYNSWYCDFTKHNDYLLVNEFDNTAFTIQASTNAGSSNKINTATIPSTLGFDGNFYHKDGINKNVMLLHAYQSNATLSLKDYTLQPKPNEIYMFQFYSIATTGSEFNGFYFMIGEKPQQITSLTDYPHYNGWQLNTVFFVAGSELNQKYSLNFTLTNQDKATGWACIDEFKIYKVNGSYANNNTSSLGVHGIYNQNSDPEGLEIANSNFDLGKSADNVNAINSSYPYPLIADSWTTEASNNGIINLDLNQPLWDDRFGDGHPGYIANSIPNNNVYMMHNTSDQTNTVVSPVLTTTAGATTYISFNAHSTTSTKTRAYIFTAETDDEGKLTNKIDLQHIDINDGAWHRYEFAIVESEFANSRNYYLRFEMQGTGFAYFDNVRTSQTNYNEQKTTATIDLNDLLPYEDAWQTADGTEFDIHYANGLTLKNIDQQKTVIKNTFAYKLSASEFYEIIIDARGNNAYLGLSDYNGLLQVTTDETDAERTMEYKLYLQPSSTLATTNLQITLGIVSTDNAETATTAGNIFIQSIKLKKISEEQYELVKANANNDNRIQILSATEEETEKEEEPTNTAEENNFFGENWWFLIPSLITAVALLLGIIAFLLRKIKFDRHIVKKTTSYARDMRMKNQQNKIVAQKAAKVDNVTDEPQNN